MRFILVGVISAVLSFPANAGQTIIDDANSLLGKLNPINIALKGLIGEAADAGNSVLQQRLEQLQGIIQLAIYQLNEAAKQRIDQLDADTRNQIADVNKLVQSDLLQFDALVGKHLKDIDESMRKRIDQFNFGLSNTIASIKILNTVPLIRTDEDGMGISAFKQQGDETRLYIVGSGLMKVGKKPSAYLSGTTVRSDFSTLWGLWGEGVSVTVENASMGLVELSIPNALIPDAYGPASFSLTLKIGEGSGLFGTKYSTQSVPLHICGKLPKLTAKLTVWASGKHYVREQRDLRDLHTSVANGNNHSSDELCLPDAPPIGWDYDMAYPDYGIVYGGENHNGYHAIVRYGPNNRCIRAYVDGTEGNAHLNVQGIRMKLIQLADTSECVPKWTSQPTLLAYGSLTQINISEQTVAAQGGECAEAKARAIPTVHTSISILDSDQKVIETKDLIPDAQVTALKGAGQFRLHNTGLLDMELDPRCFWSLIPRT